MTHRWKHSGLVLLGLVIAAGPLAGQGQSAGKGPKGGKNKVVVVNPKVHHRFRAADREVFRTYYRKHRIVVTPLRPEMARLLVIGKPLPPGLVRKALSRDLLVLVPPPAPRYTYAIVGNRIVMLNDRSLVADIIDGIF